MERVSKRIARHRQIGKRDRAELLQNGRLHIRWNAYWQLSEAHGMSKPRRLQQRLSEFGLHVLGHVCRKALLLRFLTQRKIPHASGKALTQYNKRIRLQPPAINSEWC